MASKGPEAFRTISEVADDLDLPQHVLRFWETRFTQIKPMKRGGGRRYYRPDDVDLLRGIRHLLYGEGYTIRGVQRILKEQGPRFVIAGMRGAAPGRMRAAPEDDFAADEEISEEEAVDEDAAEAVEGVDAADDEAADESDGEDAEATNAGDADEDATEDEDSEEEDSDADADDEEESGDGESDDDDAAEDESEESDEEDEAEEDEGARIEPTFNPREFRPRAPVSTPAPRAPTSRAAAVSPLNSEDHRRLQSSLAELLELKRLLDQARG